jgi:hypothetical protein
MSRPKRVHGLRTKDDRKHPVITRQLDGLPKEVHQRRHEAAQLAYAEALQAADGDKDRLLIGDDGSVTVLNRPIRFRNANPDD